ncbi:Cell division control protein 25 [Smittium culicis]|uniref:Cell division control protein 25 n=1 Tax=Smittium culicis TaxID=133412 RepID=A0A1R1WY55_9FUNG|nr:Cell division control protein 25 [Smittium culicis]
MNVFRQILKKKNDLPKLQTVQNESTSLNQDISLLINKLNQPPVLEHELSFWSIDIKADIDYILNLIESRDFLSTLSTSFDYLSLYTHLINSSLEISFYSKLATSEWPPNGLDKSLLDFSRNLSSTLKSFQNISPSSPSDPKKSFSSEDAWDMIEDVIDETHLNQLKLNEIKSKACSTLSFYPDKSSSLLQSSLGYVNSRLRELDNFISQNSNLPLSENDLYITKLVYNQTFIKSMNLFQEIAKLNSLIFMLFTPKSSDKSQFNKFAKKDKFSIVTERANSLNSLILAFFKSCESIYIDFPKIPFNSSLKLISDHYSKISSSFMSLEDSIMSVVLNPDKLASISLNFFNSHESSTNLSQFKVDHIKSQQSILSIFFESYKPSSLYDSSNTVPLNNTKLLNNNNTNHHKVIDTNSDTSNNLPDNTSASNVTTSNRRSDSGTAETLFDYGIPIASSFKPFTSLDSSVSSEINPLYKKISNDIFPSELSSDYDSNPRKLILSESGLNKVSKSRLSITKTVSAINTSSSFTRTNSTTDENFLSLDNESKSQSKNNLPSLIIPNDYNFRPRSLSSPNLSCEFDSSVFDDVKSPKRDTFFKHDSSKNNIINRITRSLTADKFAGKQIDISSYQNNLIRDKHSSDDPIIRNWYSFLVKNSDKKNSADLTNDSRLLKFPVLIDDKQNNRKSTSPLDRPSDAFSRKFTLKTSVSHASGMCQQFSVLDMNNSDLDPYELRRTCLRKETSYSNLTRRNQSDNYNSENSSVSPSKLSTFRSVDQGFNLIDITPPTKKPDIILRSFSESKMNNEEFGNSESPDNGYIVIDSSLSQFTSFKPPKSPNASPINPIDVAKSVSHPPIRFKLASISTKNSWSNETTNSPSQLIVPSPSFGVTSDNKIIEKMQKSLPEIPSKNIISEATFISSNEPSSPLITDKKSSLGPSDSPVFPGLLASPSDTSSEKLYKEGLLADFDSFLKPDYSESELILENDKVIGGTLRALIERLTPHNTSVDSEFFNAFLLNFRSFCTPVEFLGQLIDRFNMSPPELLNKYPSLLEKWVEKKKVPSNLRIYNVLKTWLDSYFYIDEDFECLDTIERFAHENLVETKAVLGARLIQLVRERKSEYSQLASGSIKRINKSKNLDLMFMSKFSNVTNLPPPPKHKLSKSIIKSLINGNPIDILDIDHVELARQLTVCESYMYCCIRPHELLGRSFTNSSNAFTFPNTIGMSKMSNQLAYWVIIYILSEESPKARAKILKYMIKVANECMLLNNFNSLFLFVSAFSSSFISRLKKTWALVDVKYITLYNNMQKITDHNRNYSYYRNLLSVTPPPALPFLGVVLTDLTFNDDGNPKFRKTNSISSPMSSRPENSEFDGIKASIKPANSLREDKLANSFILDKKAENPNFAANNESPKKKFGFLKTNNSVSDNPTMISSFSELSPSPSNKEEEGNNEFNFQSNLASFANFGSSKAKNSKTSEFVNNVNPSLKKSETSKSTSYKSSDEELPTINFSKYNRTVKIIENVQKYQVPYNLHLITELVEYLQASLKSAEEFWDDEKYYQRSLQLEPRTNR